MKKKALAALLACAMTAGLLAGCGSKEAAPAETTTTETTEATDDAATKEEAPAAEETAATTEVVKYNDIKDELGGIPAAAKDMKFNIGFCGKAFENEFWRMEKEGSEAAAKALQELGLDVTGYCSGSKR